MKKRILGCALVLLASCTAQKARTDRADIVSIYATSHVWVGAMGRSRGYYYLIKLVPGTTDTLSPDSLWAAGKRLPLKQEAQIGDTLVWRAGEQKTQQEIVRSGPKLEPIAAPKSMKEGELVFRYFKDGKSVVSSCPVTEVKN